jgi:hypothetical protein
MTSQQTAAAAPEAYSPDWVGYRIWCANRNAHTGKCGRERQANYALKYRWIEFGIETLSRDEIRLNYQLIYGSVSLLITIIGESRRWVFHAYLERFPTDIRKQVLEELGEPDEFWTDHNPQA